jgi:hypothetical protein
MVRRRCTIRNVDTRAGAALWPTTTTRPPGAARSTACSNALTAPEVSMTTG